MGSTFEKKAAPAGEQKDVPDAEHKVASNVEVKTSGAAAATEVESAQVADSSLPKCIGPGCENNAQPDSVYCGNDCILRHAAAAMKSFSNVKDPKLDKAPAQKNNSSPKVIWST